MTRVLLVDDHELIRDGLSGVFSAQQDMEVVGAAKSVAEAIDDVRGARSRTSS